MTDWTSCPHCGLRHSARGDGVCPRCKTPLAEASTAKSRAAVAAAVESPPTPTGAPAKSQKTRSILAGGGGLLGLLLSRFFGSSLLIPGIGTVVGALLLAKVGPRRARPFAGAAGLLLGHAAWMAVGALVVGVWAPMAIDLALMGVGLIWLLARPGLAPVIALTLFEAVSLVINGMQIPHVHEPLVRALFLHILLRVAAIVALFAGYVEARKQPAQPPDVAGVFE